MSGQRINQNMKQKILSYCDKDNTIRCFCKRGESDTSRARSFLHVMLFGDQVAGPYPGF